MCCRVAGLLGKLGTASDPRERGTSGASCQAAPCPDSHAVLEDVWWDTVPEPAVLVAAAAAVVEPVLQRAASPPAFSRYRTPPCTNFVDLLLVPLAKSSRSIMAAFRPLQEEPRQQQGSAGYAQLCRVCNEGGC